MNPQIPINSTRNIAQALGDLLRAAVVSGSEMTGEEMPDQARERLVQYAVLAFSVILQRMPTDDEIGMIFGQ